MGFGARLDIITAVIGCALLGSGLYGVLYPPKMARAFGVIDVTPDMAVFYPGLAIRNISAGLAVWGMKQMNQRKALGMFLLCWMLVGPVDTYILLSHKGAVDTVWLHVFNTGLLAVVGPWLLYG